MTPEEIQHLQRLAENHRQQQVHQFHQHLANEEQKLLDKVPEWKKDPELARKEIADIKRHLIDHHGYAEQDLVVIPDHRNVLAARELLLNHRRETEAKRRAADEKAKRETQRKAAADRDAKERELLAETKKKVRKNYGNTHAQAEALADAFGVNE